MHDGSVNRRVFLRIAGAAVIGTALGAGCASRGPAPPIGTRPKEKRRFAKVHVSRERILGTVVGLRPYRPSGFVVRAERHGDRTIVHNYGHGGGGISLSWGTAYLAAEEVRDNMHRECAVLGCGAVGLATACLLQRRGRKVTIYAGKLPPETTSNVPGSQWLPVSVYDPLFAGPEFEERLLFASRIAFRCFQDLVGHDYGVRWIDSFTVRDEPIRFPPYFEDLADLYPEAEDLLSSDHPFDRRFARRVRTLFVETPVYLEAVLNAFRIAGGRVVVREFGDRNDVLRLEEKVIVNCTGLGSGALFGDEEMIPVKGQLVILPPQPEVDYTLSADGGTLYMHPRRDGILLGGTHEPGVASLTPNQAEIERVLDGHACLFGERSSRS